MNITVITGSPRQNGNSFSLTKAFVEAAQARGDCVTRFDAAFLKLGGCRACDRCFSGAGACVFEDDFNLIAESVIHADAVVITMPLYWYTVPAQLKCVIDRFYSFSTGSVDVAGKKFLYIACCAENEKSAFDGACIALERTASLLGWDFVGSVLVTGVNAPGDVDAKQALAALEKLK